MNLKIIRFTAVWCMYCIYMRTKWEEIEKQYPVFQYIEYDADDNSDKHKEFNIRDVPTVIFFSEAGDEVARLEGAKDEKEIIKIINSKF